MTEQISEILRSETPTLEAGEVKSYVRSFSRRRDTFLRIRQTQGSPLYLFDRTALLERARRFREAFQAVFADFRAYYAVKSNNHPGVAQNLVEAGFGLDVSSGLELDLALKCGCGDIIFSGPGKTDAELRQAVDHDSAVTVLLDSFAELDRLEDIAKKRQCRVRAGVRLTADETGLWRKFGIPPASLRRFLEQAQTRSHVSICGLQFHTSWNRGPSAQVEFIGRVGQTLRELPSTLRSALTFLDIGGGFWPERGEWLQPAATPAGRLHQALSADIRPSLEHYKLPAQPIENFAREIAAAMATHIHPLISCQLRTEPGRWLSDDAMHLLLTVVDKKAADLVITDGGTNTIGWERFENDYAPAINLSRPSEVEHPCLVLGSLCTPHDVWGYAYFGDGIEPGDVLLIPGQGAYTYSLRQQFIKPIARVIPIA
jgi:diaminopimelate decarboxylase